MLDFLKIFGEGFLFFIGLPFILVGLVIYGLYLFVIFIVMSIKGLILFFKGKKYSLMLPEDLKADEILKKGINLNPQVQTQTVNNSSVTYNSTYNQINISAKTNNNEGLKPVDYLDQTNGDNVNGFLEGNSNGQWE